MLKRPAHDDRAVAAHERRRMAPERLGERTAERGIAHEHVAGAASRSPDVEDRHALPEERAHMVEGPERHARDAERYTRWGVVVNYRTDVWPDLVDLGE